MPQNKTWKTVYIRVRDGGTYASGAPKWKWVAIGRLYGYGTLNKNWKVVFDE